MHTSDCIKREWTDLYAGSSLCIYMKSCVRTDLQNIYPLVKLFFYIVSKKNMTASWNLHLALNLMAVTNKAKWLEKCKQVQGDTVHIPTNSV
jgi:hypothetical protein